MIGGVFGGAVRTPDFDGSTDAEKIPRAMLKRWSLGLVRVETDNPGAKEQVVAV